MNSILNILLMFCAINCSAQYSTQFNGYDCSNSAYWYFDEVWSDFKDTFEYHRIDQKTEKLYLDSNHNFDSLYRMSEEGDILFIGVLNGKTAFPNSTTSTDSTFLPSYTVQTFYRDGSIRSFENNHYQGPNHCYFEKIYSSNSSLISEKIFFGNDTIAGTFLMSSLRNSKELAVYSNCYLKESWFVEYDGNSDQLQIIKIVLHKKGEDIILSTEKELRRKLKKSHIYYLSCQFSVIDSVR